MQKAKKYDWKDSNLALFGSDTEKAVSPPLPPAPGPIHSFTSQVIYGTSKDSCWMAYLFNNER